MMFRPGLGYKGATKSNAAAKFIPFVKSTTDTALLEFTDSFLRVWVNETPITRGSVSTTVTNGDFTASIASWTTADESGGTSSWTANSGGCLSLVSSNGIGFAITRQQITVAAADQNDEHALRVVIAKGKVFIRVGSSSGADDYVTESELAVGTHSLAFTPAGNFWIEFKQRTKYASYVASCNVEASGVMSLPSPYLAANLGNIRYEQSGDVVYLACDTFQQRKIERRSTNSWSIVTYRPEDGPFLVENVTPTTIAASAISGDITLTASKPIFKSTNVESLYQISSVGQNVSASIADQNTFTNSIRVIGVSTARSFSISITGTWVATVTLQRSFDSGASWVDVTSYTTNQATTYSDGLDNQIILYRIGVKTGNYTSGTVVTSLSITTGSITGVARVTGYTSETVVSAEVLTDLGGTSATDVWAEGTWSDRRKWPTTVALHDGRLWWAGHDKIIGSVSDAYEGFDPNIEGDSAPIQRSIGFGPVDSIHWILSLGRMLVGSDGTEFAVKASSLDEPLTPTNFGMKAASGQGSAAIQGLNVKTYGVYVQRGGIRLFEISFNPQIYEYESQNLSALVPEIGSPGITRIAYQTQPDIRIHCVRSDGTVAILVFDKNENVNSWSTITTDGTIEDVIVLPSVSGTQDDQVYYVVNRTINGSTVRYLEKLALESECVGGTLNKQMDAFAVYSGASTTTITGASHLEGETVSIWADGIDSGTATVSGGQFTLSTAASNVVYGLSYVGQWKSAKLTTEAARIIGKHKGIHHIILLMADTHYQGVKFGPDFSSLDNLPLVEEGTTIAANTVHLTFDTDPIPFDGRWDTDSRVCLQAQSPRPCTMLAMAVEYEAY
jgi:hypothetical protein